MGTQVVLRDDGGVAGLGIDTSDVRTLLVEFVKVNAAPSFALAQSETVCHTHTLTHAHTHTHTHTHTRDPLLA